MQRGLLRTWFVLVWNILHGVEIQAFISSSRWPFGLVETTLRLLIELYIGSHLTTRCAAPVTNGSVPLVFRFCSLHLVPRGVCLHR